MKKIGDVTSTADKNGEWTNGNVAAGIPPTVLESGWLNSVQREIIGVLTKAGIPQDKNNDNQLSEAISKIITGGNYATAEDLKKKLAKDQNGADIPDKPKFIENLGLPELLDNKFDKTGGTIKAISAAINIQTQWSQSGYINISGEDGRTIHQMGKIGSDNGLTLRNVAEGGQLTLSGDSVIFNGKSIDVVTNATNAGYIQISDENKKAIHQIGKIDAGTKLTLNNVAENAALVLSAAGVSFNGRKMGYLCEALNSGSGWWRDNDTGLLIQWGTTPAGTDIRWVLFPIPFVHFPHFAVHVSPNWYPGAEWGIADRTKLGMNAVTTKSEQGGLYMALGF